MVAVIGLEAEVGLEDLAPEVIKGIGQGLMAEGVLIDQVRMAEEAILTVQDTKEEAAHLETGQEHMIVEDLPGILDQGLLIEDNYNLLLN